MASIRRRSARRGARDEDVECAARDYVLFAWRAQLRALVLEGYVCTMFTSVT